MNECKEAPSKRKSSLLEIDGEVSRKREKSTGDEGFVSLCNESSSGDEISEEEDFDSNRDFFGLPSSVKRSLEEFRNVKKLYEWQLELLVKLNNDSRNVIYCVPTSGGKTLVAELLILKELLINKKDALFIFPYISIVQEKIRQLSPFALKYNFLVEEYAGPKGTIPVKMRRKFKSLYVATIEKAHLLITSMLQMNQLERLGIVVVDELHMIGDGSRGAVLETLLVKLKLAQKMLNINIRTIGMSATLSNLNDIATFLNADVFERNYRPVALKEFIKRGSQVYEYIPKTNEFKPVRELHFETNDVVIEDPQHLRILVKEVVPDSSILIFCSTKRRCEVVSRMLSENIPELKKHKRQEKRKLMIELYRLNNGSICQIMRKTIPCGIVYHHSGLTSEERELIENAYLSGILCCIVCTSTLAAGVNLPAQRVIIRDPFIGSSPLTKTFYKQMSGRAGRAGFNNEVGESILIAPPEDIGEEEVKSLLVAPVIYCRSALDCDNCNGLAVLMLNLFHLHFVNSFEEFRETILQNSLFGVQFGIEDDFSEKIDCSFEKLIEMHLLCESEEQKITISSLGIAVVKGLINIDKCKRIYNQLEECSLSFNLSTDLHLIYLATLLYDEDEFGIVPDATKFYDSYSALNDEEHRAAAVIGIKPGAVTRFRLSGVPNEKIKRFYITLIVFDLKKNLTDLSVLASRFGVQRGTLQNLMAQLASNASCLLRFVGELKEFEKLQSVLHEFPKSLYYCCNPELIPLLELPAVKIGRAKQLHSAGFKSITEIAKSSVKELVNKIDNFPRKQAQEIIRKAKSIVLATADELEVEAKELTDIAAN